MNRIAIVGNAGGGKTTLAHALGDRLGIPVHEVDRVQFRADWSRAPTGEVQHVLDGWVAEDAWIVDGFGPWPAIERRLAAADTIVWIDLPLRTHLWRALKKRDRPSRRLMVRMVLHVHTRYRRTIERALAPHAGKVVRLRSPRAVREFASRAPTR